MTKEQFKNLTGLDDIKPFLGCILSDQDGTFVYQTRHMLEDLVDATKYWNIYMRSSRIPVHDIPDDVDDISNIMSNIMQCLTRDTLAIDDETTVAHLESLKPEQLSMLFLNTA